MGGGVHNQFACLCHPLGSEHRDGLEDKREKGSALVVAVQAWSSLPRGVEPTEASSELSPPPLGLTERPEAECGEQSGTEPLKRAEPGPEANWHEARPTDSCQLRRWRAS